MSSKSISVTVGSLVSSSLELKKRLSAETSIFATVLERCQNADRLKIWIDTVKFTDKEILTYKRFRQRNLVAAGNITTLELCGCEGFPFPRRVHIFHVIFTFVSLRRLSLCHFENCWSLALNAPPYELCLKEISLNDCDVSMAAHMLRYTNITIEGLSITWSAASVPRFTTLARFDVFRRMRSITSLVADVCLLREIGNYLSELPDLSDLEISFPGMLSESFADIQIPRSVRRLKLSRKSALEDPSYLFTRESGFLVMIIRLAIAQTLGLSSVHVCWTVQAIDEANAGHFATRVADMLSPITPQVAILVELPTQGQAGYSMCQYSTSPLVHQTMYSKALSSFGRRWV